MRFCIVLLLLVAVICAQLMPGSTNSYIANGKGGLGRYIRHMEGRDGMSYYPNGNAFGYSPGLFGFFG